MKWTYPNWAGQKRIEVFSLTESVFAPNSATSPKRVPREIPRTAENEFERNA